MLATIVEGDQKAPFTIATTPKCSFYISVWLYKNCSISNNSV